VNAGEEKTGEKAGEGVEGVEGEELSPRRTATRSSPRRAETRSSRMAALCSASAILSLGYVNASLINASAFG
jgi:hypothetical protein